MFSSISKIDRRIISVFSCIFVAALTVLYFDLFSNSKVTSNQPVIAKTIEITNDIRIKQKDQFDWSKSVLNNNLHYGDQIFSGSNSNTVIQLNDGQKLKIAENSLIRFDQKQGVKNFKIMFGSLTAQVKKNEVIEVTICGEKHKIKATNDDDILISNNNNCIAPEIKLKKSSISSYLPKKKNKIFAQLSQPAPEVVIIPKKEPVVLKAPEIVKTKIVMKPTTKFQHIEWPAVPNATSYKVLFMDSDNSNRIIKTVETKDLFYDFEPLAEYNNYTYKIEAVGDMKDFLTNTSVAGTIKIKYEPIKIAKPETILTMNARTSDQPAKIVEQEIKWDKTPRAAFYKVEFSDNPDFNPVTETEKTKTNALKINLTNFGKKHYRIKSYTAKGKDLSKSYQQSYVDYVKKFDLSPPQISEKLKNQSFFFQNTDGKFIKLSWENTQIEKAPNHYIEISNTPDFKNVINSFSTKKQIIFLNQSIIQGKYYWRVKSYSPTVISDWSETAVLKIASKRNIASEDK